MFATKMTCFQTFCCHSTAYTSAALFEHCLCELQFMRAHT